MFKTYDHDSSNNIKINGSLKSDVIVYSYTKYPQITLDICIHSFK